MKTLHTFALAACLSLSGYGYAQPNPSIYTAWEKGFTRTLQNTHDMALPVWGPYSNRFNGITHVPKQNDGIRFDVVVQPSFHLRNLTTLANTQRESGYHPWEATPDLSYFSYRFELEWKDRVYCDVSFSKIDEQSRLIKAQFVNNTNNNRSLALNIFNSIIFPYGKRVSVLLPVGTQWQSAAQYVSLTDSIIAPNYNLVYNGQLRGQVNDDNAVSHTAILTSKSEGEKLIYKISNTQPISDAVIVFRYRNSSGRNTRLQATVNGKISKELTFNSSRDYTLATLKLGNWQGGDVDLSLKTVGDAPIALDGLLLMKKGDVPSLVFKEEKLNETPKQLPAGIPNAVIFKYDDINEYYGLAWSDTLADRRVILDDNPDEALSKFDNLVKSGGARLNNGRINGNHKGWFENIFSAPIVVKPKQQASRYAVVVYGNTQAEVAGKLKTLNAGWATANDIYRWQQAKVNDLVINKAGLPYLPSRQLMAATTLTNLIYPVFAGNQYFKHTTPGKRWSSFYTWDSGFIGIGYTELNKGRALESLNAYTMDSSEQSAYLEHGTPLPVQAYLFNEIWNKTQNQEYLAYFYPRLKRYYDFLGGAESSPTRQLKSGMVQTWDIFYNSGGWDDYSPQVFTHKEKIEKYIAPVINTSHQIRFAKLLSAAAWQLGYQKDIEKYNEDISNYSKALQRYSWHDTSGYFGYVKHDARGAAIGILKHSSGQNFNMGLDGCSPLIAGICTPAQQQKILSHLFTKGQLWTDQGITAIDQSANYYSKDGYWNGRVWMPHQWFMWKTMFDLNQPEKAIQIAQTALNVWKRETDDTYNCWENFSVESGNGGGWHQFGALSSPVLNWFSALYKPGTVTYGFNMWCTSQKFSAVNDGFKGEFKLFADPYTKGAAMLLCLNEKYNYQARCNGKSIPIKKVLNGLYIINIDAGQKDKFTLDVIKKS
jgi:hypothetical protein